MRKKGSRYAAIVCACAMVFSSVPVYASDDIPVDAQNEEVQEQNANEKQEVKEEDISTDTTEQTMNEVQNSSSMPTEDTTNTAQIVGMSIEGAEDKENIATPADLKAKIKLKNLWQQGAESVTYVGLNYQCNGQKQYFFYNNKTQYRDNDNEEATLEVPIPLDEYYGEGQYQLIGIQIIETYSENDERMINYSYDVATGAFADEAGNQYVYSQEADFCVTKSEKAGQIYGQLDNLTISNQEDKDQIKAPADIMMTMDAANIKEDDPFTVDMVYDRDGETYKFSNTYGNTESEEKAIYKDGKIQFPIKIGEYDRTGSYQLKQIVVTDSKTNRSVEYNYDEEQKQFTAYDVTNMYSFSYNGEADFTIAVSDYGEGVPVEIMGLSVVGDKSHITQQSDAKIQIKAKNLLSKGIKSVVVVYKNTENEGKTTLSKFYYLPEWFPGEEGDVCEIPISFEHHKFSSAGQYILESISFKLEDYPEESVCYTNKNGTLEGEYSKTGAKMGFAYNGEVDLNVMEAPEEDTEAPYVNSIKFCDEEKVNDLYSSKYNDDLKLEVGYTENLTGILSCTVTWQKTDDMRYGPEASNSFVVGEVKAGTGTFEIAANMQHVEPGTYQATKIEIQDQEYLLRTYTQGSEKGILVDEKGNTVSVEHISFTVKQAQDNGLKVNGMRWEDGIDATKLQVGDHVKGYLTVQNTSQKDIVVDPEECYIFWNAQGGSTMIDSYAKCEGKKFVLKSGCDRELPFILKIESDTSVSGDRYLKAILLNRNDKNASTMYFETGRGPGEISYSRTIEPIGISVETVVGMQEFKYSVIGAVSEAVEEEPVIEGLSVENASVNAGDNIKLKIKVADTQKLPIMYMTMTWKNKSTNQAFVSNIIFPEADYTYSENEHCYYVNIPTNSLWDEGEYYLSGIAVSNKVSGFVGYSADEKGIMHKYQGENLNTFETVSVTLAKEETAKVDYVAPVLESVELAGSDKVKSPGEVTYRIKATDANRLSEVRLSYLGNKGINAMILKSSSIKEESEGTYLCTFKIGEYHETGDYQLQTIGLIDGSAYKNDRAYKYNEETGEFESQDIDSVKVAGNLALTKEGNEVIASGEKNLEDEVKKASEGTTIVVADLQKELIIPTETMEEIKDKKLTLVVADDDRTSKLIINGKDLTKVPEKDLKVTVERGMMTEEKIQVGEETDELYYPVNVTTTDASIPVTLRVKLDEEFLKQISKKNICLSRRNADGMIGVINEHVSVTTDGYVEYAFEGGLSDRKETKQSLPTELDELHSAVTLASDLNSTVEEYEFIISAPKKEESDVVLGDINQDGFINIQDLMLCLNHVSQKSLLTGEALTAADVDESGAVDIRDLMRLLNYVSGKSATL